MRRFGETTLIFICAAVLSCGPVQQIAVEPPGTGGGPPIPPGGTCLEPDDVNSPWLVGLDATSRGTIARNAERGLVLVKQGECGTFQMLADCFLKEQPYTDIPAQTIRPDAVEVSNRRQLQKKVPLAVAKYAAKMDDNESWSLDYVDAGEKSYSESIEEINWNKLRPSCRAATHYVYKITRGAFQLSMVNDSERMHEGKIGPADFKNRSKRRKVESSRDGDYAGCAASSNANIAACKGLIRMWVEPIPSEMLSLDTRKKTSPSAGQTGPPTPWTPDEQDGQATVNYGWINVTSNYTGIPVMVDGTDVGKSPIKDKRVGVGEHNVTLSNRCVYQGNKTVNVTSGETSDIRIELVPKEGAVRLLTVDDNGKPVKADVYIDGKKIGSTDGTLKSSTLKRNICDNGKDLEVRATGYQTVKKKLTIKERGYTDLTLELKKAYVAPPKPKSVKGKGGLEWIYSKPASVQFTKSEVTLGQFKQCVNAGGCNEKNRKTKSDGKSCNWGHSGRDNHPMNCVDWYGAKDFCEWAGGRLPTGDEWYAEASNGGAWRWPWGDSPEVTCSYAVGDGSNTAGCGKDRTWPVCSKTKGNSVSGLCDMTGNVREWTSDLHGSDGDTRGERGGSWLDDDKVYMFLARQEHRNPSKVFTTLGFRCVRSSH